VSLEISERHGVRYLHFGSELVQGAMRIARPWSLELEYTRELMMPLLLRPRGWPRDVLQAGLGTGSTAKFLYRWRPRSRTTVVELLPTVVAAAYQYFRLPDDAKRLRVEVGDAHDYVATARGEFDLIVVDAFDAEGRAGMLEQAPFYLNCRGRLREGGLVAVNLLDRGRGVKAGVERLRAAFDGHVCVLPRRYGGNTIAIAGARALEIPPHETLVSAAAKLKAETGLDLSPTIARLM
jgi:spermidine synthase